MEFIYIYIYMIYIKRLSTVLRPGSSQTRVNRGIPCASYLSCPENQTRDGTTPVSPECLEQDEVV